MSTTIDQRVVEMQFDNKHFERNVATTMSTLDKLKQGLNLTGATKGLSDLGDAAKGINLSGLGGAVETVQAKFSALGVIGVTALANITNQAVNTGKRMISALTIDPIKTGFSEYETKINSIQTIMSNTASKGTTMEDVTRVIGELNEYADKTIYNFAEMTRNIGTFTAAGIGLEDSASAIQGIANLAAMSGSTSQQASTAMYQLSQAMASGTVKLMDWNSVVNAGMGGELFQNALKDTAKAHGVAVDTIIKKHGSFRESLSEGWITADILTETLSKMTKSGAAEYLSNLTGVEQTQIEAAQKLVAENKDGTASYEKLAEQLAKTGKVSKQQALDILKMADNAEDAATKVKTFTQLWDTLKESAQSGWSQTWELLVGDFEEAKEFLTDLSDLFGGIISESADRRNKLLSTALSDKTLGVSAEEMQRIEQIAQRTGKSIDEVLDARGVRNGRELLLDSLMNTIEAVRKVIAPVKEAFRDIFPETTAQQLYNILESIENFTSKLKLSETASNNLKRTFKGLFAIFDIGKEILTAVFKAVKPLFGGLDDLGGGILGVTASWGDWLVNFRDSVKEADIFNRIFERVTQVIKTIADGAKQLAGAFKDKFIAPGLEILDSILSRAGKRMNSLSDVSASMRETVVNAIKAMGDALANSNFMKLVQTLWNGVKTIGSALADAFGSITGSVIGKLGNGDFVGFFDALNSLIAGGIGVGIIRFLKSATDTFKGFQDITEGVVDIFDGVRGCFEAYQTQLKAGTLMKIAGAIAILTAAIVVLALIDSKKLNEAIGAITMLFAELMGSMAIFSKISGDFKGVAKATGAMVGMSIAVLILAAAMKTLGSMEWEDLAKGVLGVAALMGIVVASVKILGKGKKDVVKGAVQMVIFAAAIKILVSACEDLSALSWEDLAKGLVGVGLFMAEIIAFLKLAKFSGKSITTATGIVILAAAMKIFASVVQDMSGMSWEAIAKGLTGIAGALLAVTLAVKFMPKNMVSIGVGLIAVAGAMKILAEVLGTMGNMEWTEIGKGLAALGGSIAILAIGLNLMKGTLGGSAALLVATTSLAILVPVMKSLGGLSWGEIARGLVSIAGAFTVLGIAGLVLGPIVPTILGLAGAFALIGVGVLAIGAGLVVAGAGLSALAIGFSALATAVAGGATAITAGLTVVVMGIANLIPMVIQKIGEGLIRFCAVIRDGAPAVGDAVKAIVLSLVDVLVECVPAIADGALQLIAGVLSALVTYTPQIVDSLFGFLIALLDGIAKNLPKLIQSAVNVVMSFFHGVVDALRGIDVSALLKGIVGVGLLSALMLALSAVAGLVPGAMVGVLGMGVVIAELALVLAAIGALAQIPGLKWLIDEGGELLGSIGTAIGSFIGGIVGGIMGGVTAQIPQIGADLSAFMTNLQPFLEGAKAIDPAVVAGVKAIAETILILTAANVLDGLTSWLTGGSSLDKFGEQLPALGTNLSTFAATLGTFDESKVATVTCAANAVKALAEAADAIPNEGGWAAKIFGENSIAAFAEQLPTVGTKLGEFATNLGTFDENKVATVTCAANAIKAMAAAGDSIDGQAEWAKKLFGDNGISAFSDQLPAVGANLSSFAKNLGTFGADKVATVDSAVNAISAVAKLADTDLKGAKNNIGDFGDKLAGFADDIAAFCSDMPNEASVASAVAGLRDILSAIDEVNAANTGALGTLADNLKKVGGNAVNKFVGAFTSKTAKTDVKDAADALADKAVDGLDDIDDDAEDAGEDFGSGLVRGINSKKQAAYDAGYALGQKAVQGEKDGQKSKSPSKLTTQAGRWLGEGLVVGIKQMGQSVYRAGYNMGESATDAISSSIALIAAAVDSDMDVQPTIRPVMDLSEVKTGAAAIGSLMNMHSAFGVTTNIGAISRMMNRQNQNGSNDDVVSAIKDLGKGIDNLPRESYSIGNVNVNGDAEVEEAIRVLVRAVTMERRV